ncbi:MAG TPA: DNA replication/repair protein RecF [Chiayiivirga sp.]|nr:DNA replication/repair protein RecF [Chiayiivirga sp.]
MRLASLSLEDLRVFREARLEPGTGINVLVGDNGAGKTTVLEAIQLLSSGRSFRGGVRDALIRRGQPALRVYSEIVAEPMERRVGMGLSRSLRAWSARIDGQAVETLTRLFQELAVVCFEPGSHALISGGSEHRRRFIDWALFHVEPDFLPIWRRYQRALRQRNALLKQPMVSANLDPWEHELALHGAALTRLREAWLARLQPGLSAMVARFAPGLGAATPKYSSGGSPASDGETGLLAALWQARGRDQALGHTSVGPHRADWSLAFEAAPVREMLSRGQEKLVVLSCLLAQAQAFAEVRGQWPVLVLDDLPSELDRGHLAHTLEWLASVPAQSFITATAAPELPHASCRPMRMFHVEQGRVAALLY